VLQPVELAVNAQLAAEVQEDAVGCHIENALEPCRIVSCSIHCQSLRRVAAFESVMCLTGDGT
jgi:hypothetical protein